MLNCKSLLTAISLPRKTTASETGITKMRKACKCSVLEMRAVSSEVDQQQLRVLIWFFGGRAASTRQ